MNNPDQQDFDFQSSNNFTSEPVSSVNEAQLTEEEPANSSFLIRVSPLSRSRINFHSTNFRNISPFILAQHSIQNQNRHFQSLYFRISLTYAQLFPDKARRFIECTLLVNTILIVATFIYIHNCFVQSPITCLDHLYEKKFNSSKFLNSGILRIELVRNISELDDIFNLTKSYQRELRFLYTSDSENFLFDNFSTQSDVDKSEKDIADNDIVDPVSETIINSDSIINRLSQATTFLRDNFALRILYGPFKYSMTDLDLLARFLVKPDAYIIEYSNEYGLLRFSPKSRARLNVTVHLELVDINNAPCLGGAFNRFLLDEFLGYDEILMGSVRRFAESQNSNGFVRNAISGDQIRLPTINSHLGRSSYVLACIVMITFTGSVSILLRYSYYQIFLFIVDLMQMLENNSPFSFPIAPLITVILALVGMETIMTGFFSDSTTAFYIILIIWIGDQYEGICCQTSISRKFWPRFFFLYQSFFYCYYHRFNGQFSGIALLATSLLILHAMLYFFHHYELPRLLRQYNTSVIHQMMRSGRWTQPGAEERQTRN